MKKRKEKKQEENETGRVWNVEKLTQKYLVLLWENFEILLRSK